MVVDVSDLFDVGFVLFAFGALNQEGLVEIEEKL